MGRAWEQHTGEGKRVCGMASAWGTREKGTWRGNWEERAAWGTQEKGTWCGKSVGGERGKSTQGKGTWYWKSVGIAWHSVISIGLDPSIGISTFRNHSRDSGTA